MKKVLAIVLALVMVCTMAMAITTSTTGAVATTTSLKAADYSVINMNDSTNTAVKVNDIAGVAITMSLTTTTPKVHTEDDETTTTYYADKYVLGDFSWYAVDSSAAQYKLVKGGKVVAFLTDDATAASTTAVVAKTVKYAKGATLKCGDYDVANTNAAVTVYEIGDKAYVANAEGNSWAYLNGTFVKYTNTALEVKTHAFSADKYNAANGTKTSVYCTSCKEYIPVIETAAIPATSADLYAAVANHAGYSYLVKAVSTATAATTNPDTGANDVIGVAAALAVVALVSGAAISLKK